MSAATPVGTPVVTDFDQFARLRAGANRDDPEALRAAARQFEALMTQELFKAARASSSGDALLGGEQGEFYQDMFDQQMALHLSSGKGLGIADLLIQQMQLSTSLAPTEQANPVGRAAPATAAMGRPTAVPIAIGGRNEFVQELMPHAQKAAQALGISPHTLIAQAALETGWGRKMIRTSDGAPSFNFFGIKADKSWDGARAQTTTTEFVEGQPRRESASFRAYGSMAEGFDDYVRFLQSQPRYRKALAGDGDEQFVQGLQKAGYATDPAYAHKVLRLRADTVAL